MREIKFRSYTPSGMVEITKIDLINGWATFDDVLGEQEFNIEEFPLLQYTGLQDINGEEIYEGDIISGGSGRIPTLIKWDDENNCWMAFNLRRKEEHDLDKYFNRYIGEVIGNIYENPELVKGEQ